MNEANETIDEGVRATLRSTNDATKEAVLFDLIDQVIAYHEDEPRLPLLIIAKSFREEMVKLANGEGGPPPTPEEIEQAKRYRAKPNWTEEDEAEEQRIIATLDNAISAEEFLRQLDERSLVGMR